MVALQEPADGLARLAPLGLVADDRSGPGAPAGELGHRVDDRVVLERPAPPAIDDAGDEIAPDEVERGVPAADPDPVALAERLEPAVVTDRMALVLGDVLGDRELPAGPRQRREEPVVRDGGVADRAGRQLGVGAGRLAERDPAAGADRRLRDGSVRGRTGGRWPAGGACPGSRRTLSIAPRQA